MSAAGADKKTEAAIHAAISWEGDTRETLRQWPQEVRVDFGVALHEMQEGRPATLSVRPMQSIGRGAFELKTEDEGGWYRLMYLSRIGNVIYVLDCFKKDSRKTEKKDLARFLARYKRVKQRLLEETTHGKHAEQARPPDDGKRARRT